MDTKTMIVWLVSILMLGTIICAPVGCTMRRQSLVAEAIKNGADPIAAKCAIEGDAGDNRTSAMCMVKALEPRK